ncbi:probable E3 ubiquitin-protein ligase makorin-1 isoform X2 [Xenopus laevis]|uniref:RING-type E3 ubiquitin transferase n=1 Tax=Xenopus laevis TaxID=8355 RepID=A0A8J0UXZ9_XENLA|nr:probable E3 ubiquitin-protein ligase makorin-1 isoform X2 [Xenopus laevis]
MAEAAAAPALLTSAASAGKAPLPAFPENPPVGVWTRHVTCRYFIHGVCKEGINCRYSHDLTTSRSAMICRYFQRGCCAYGDRCRYEHNKPLQEDPTGDTCTAPSESLPEPSGDINTPEAYTQGTVKPDEGREEPADPELKKQLCPYAAMGECRYGENCVYLHGDPCDMCGLQVLHPVDTCQRSQHIKSCIEAHEKDMELSFAVQRSKDIVCGICMEVVYEKTNPSERRFGILSNCSHSYCLKCIRKWRSAKQFESKIIKSCPECRITSNFIIPSEYWVEEKEEKHKLIHKYKEAMSSKSCRYFDEGRGTCPFGGNCFYRHAYPDGRIEEPQPRQKSGMSSRYRSQRRNRFWEFDEREGGDPFENEEDEVVTFELGEMLLMLLAAGGAAEELTDSEDDWDFHDDSEDFYDLDLL